MPRSWSTAQWPITAASPTIRAENRTSSSAMSSSFPLSRRASTCLRSPLPTPRRPTVPSSSTRWNFRPSPPANSCTSRTPDSKAPAPSHTPRMSAMTQWRTVSVRTSSHGHALHSMSMAILAMPVSRRTANTITGNTQGIRRPTSPTPANRRTNATTASWSSSARDAPRRQSTSRALVGSASPCAIHAATGAQARDKRSPSSLEKARLPVQTRFPL